MKYWQFVSMIRPYFVSRWLELVWWEQGMYNFIHLWLQSAWNYSDWPFKKNYEILSPVENNDWWIKTYRYKTTFKFTKVWTCHAKNNPNNRFYYWSDFTYLEQSNENYIVFKVNPWDLEVTYYKPYEWITLSTSTQQDMPFPDAFNVALLYKVFDTWSPILSFEWERTPAYVKADAELSKLAEMFLNQDDARLSYNLD